MVRCWPPAGGVFGPPSGGLRLPRCVGLVGTLLRGQGRRSVGWARAGGQGRPVAPASHADLVGRAAPLWGGAKAFSDRRSEPAPASPWLPLSARLVVAEGRVWRCASARVGGAPSPTAAGPPRLRRQAGDHGGSLGAGEWLENSTAWESCQEQTRNEYDVGSAAPLRVEAVAASGSRSGQWGESRLPHVMPGELIHLSETL